MIQGADISSAQLSISFEGEHSFDAALLGTTLTNFAALIHDVIGDNNDKHVCSVQVTSFDEGSFLTNLRLVLERLPQIELPFFLQNAANLVTVVTGFFALKQAFRSMRPKEIVVCPSENRVLITSEDGTQISAPIGTEILYQNKDVDMHVAAISRAASLSGREMRFIDHQSGQTTTFDLPALRDMSEVDYPAGEHNEQKEETERVTLPIKKVALIGASKWSFQYGSRTIQASIEDKAFLAAVHKGETAYSAGDKLDVDLVRRLHLGADHSLISESFAIIHVYQKLSPSAQPVQTSMFDPPESPSAQT